MDSVRRPVAILRQVQDENAENLGARSAQGAKRAFGTPIHGSDAGNKLSGAAASAPRKTLSNITNTNGGSLLSRNSSGGVKNSPAAHVTSLQQPAPPKARRALGDITNDSGRTSASLAVGKSPGLQIKQGTASKGPSLHDGLFAETDARHLANLYARDGVESLLGLSGREQERRAEEKEDAEIRARVATIKGGASLRYILTRATDPPLSNSTDQLEDNGPLPLEHDGPELPLISCPPSPPVPGGHGGLLTFDSLKDLPADLFGNGGKIQFEADFFQDEDYQVEAEWNLTAKDDDFSL